MKFKTKIPETLGFQLTPMLDVVFILLIFFVVTQQVVLDEQDIDVEVPTAVSEDDKDAARALDEIIINAREEDGDLIITIDREVFTREKLHAMLQRMISVNPNQPVRIRGDAQMSWQRMADVISTCSQAGVWNVSFSKQMPETKK